MIKTAGVGVGKIMKKYTISSFYQHPSAFLAFFSVIFFKIFFKMTKNQL